MRTRLITLSCLALIAGCGGQEQGERGQRPESTVRVIAEPVSLRADSRRVDAVGTARARQAATIFAETGGEVTSVRFTPGDRVEAGARLLTLESSEERLAVALAEVELRDARQLLERYERIDVPGAVSDSQRDAARIAVEAAEIQLRLARETLAKREVRAPFSGHVGISDVDVGARITPQTPITELDDRTELFVDFDAPEQVFGAVSPGDTLELIPFAASRAPREARVLTVGSRIDPQRRLFTVRTVIDNADDSLRPGMSFRVSFRIEGEPYPVVPEAALVWGGDGAYLWVVEEGVARRRSVTIVSRDQGVVLVDGDLEAGDLIVAEGVQKVRDGAPVETGSHGALPETAAAQGLGGTTSP